MTMKPFLTLLAALCIATAAHAQTIKSLGYNTTNGQVVANTGTNVLTFTNAVSFGGDLSITNGALAWGGGVVYEPETGAFSQEITADAFNAGVDGTNSVFIAISSNGITIEGNVGENVFELIGTNLAGVIRKDFGIPLPALTNTSNITMMRALSGSTNTNEPFSGTVSVVGTNNTNTLTFSNGILQSVQ
jgi:hypothetical protein